MPADARGVPATGQSAEARAAERQGVQPAGAYAADRTPVGHPAPSNGPAADPATDVTDTTDAAPPTATHTDLAALAARHALPRLGGRPPLGNYLRQLWGRRFFGFELARARFRSANEQDRLGIAWVVLRPLINAAVYGAIFGLLLPSSSRHANFVASLVAGVFVFQFFSGSLADGAKSITGNAGLVRSLHFPRAVLPLATVLEQMLALGPMMVVLLGISLLTGEPVRLAWLLIVPALGLMTLFCAGVAMFAGRLTIHVRDVTQLIPFLTRMVFYLSGIFYAARPGASGGQGLLATVLEYNPVHVYIRLVRGAVIVSDPADAKTWWLAVAYGVGFAVLGLLYFWGAEDRYGRE